MAASQPQTKSVPIHFEGQVVPGVMGEVYYDDIPLLPSIPPAMEWKITVHHVNTLQPQIETAIRALPGVVIAPNEQIHLLPRQQDPSSYLEYYRFQGPPPCRRMGGKRSNRKSRKGKKALRKTKRRHGRR